MGIRYLTSESVCMGHPDKLCDRISDAVLDAYLKQDYNARVAVETMASKGKIFLAGQITSTATVDVERIVRDTIREVGYDGQEKGLDYKTCEIITNINAQSADIALGVDKLTDKETGSGDQGIMYGYASDETASFLPLPFDLATGIVRRLDECRTSGRFSWLYPDGKAQVTVAYDERGALHHIHSIVVSCQHAQTITLRELQENILREVILPVTGIDCITADTRIHINPTGAFHIGGPEGDTGLTGRKLMVDTYGGYARHGGGAFSGKDATKLDRSGAYMARYVAKNIVAAQLAKKCEVSVSYCIGQTEPEAVDVMTFGTGILADNLIAQAVKRVFSFAVGDIIDWLELREPVFKQTSCYGHFGNSAYRWEKTDKVSELRK